MCMHVTGKNNKKYLDACVHLALVRWPFKEITKNKTEHANASKLTHLNANNYCHIIRFDVPSY